MKIGLFILTQLIFFSTSAQQKDSTAVKDSTFNTLKKLDEVQVASGKSFIRFQADKTVINVQNNLTAAGGTLMEVLQKAPGVTVTNDEIINLAGKPGVNIYIDGRPSQLSGKDLSAWLKATPAAMVDKVEIILNPSAKYDAQGNAGIINIRMKKNTAQGTNGSTSFSYTQSNHPNYDASATVNHRGGKWNVYGNMAARKWRQNTNGFINRQINGNSTPKTFLNSTVDEDASKNGNLTLGADYTLNKKNTLGIIVKGNEYSSRLYTPGTTLMQTHGITDSSLQTINDNHERTSRNNYNLNYSYKDTLGRTLSADADWVTYRNNSNGAVQTQLLNHQMMPYGFTVNNQNVRTQINIYSIKTDYAQPIKKINASFETGAKWSTVQTNNNLSAQLLYNNQMITDTSRTNIFDYKEQTAAAYSTLSKTTKKWEYQLGLRAEWTTIHGTSYSLKLPPANYPDTDYVNLFPSAFIQYHINESNSMRFAYSRRIDRPTFQNLNPFEYIYDYYSREKGNPFLLPAFGNNAELSWNWKDKIQTSIGYRHASHFFQSITEQRGEYTLASEQNIGYENQYFLNNSSSISITPWWESYANIGLAYRMYSGHVTAGKITNEAWALSWYTSQSFTLSKQWNAQISSWGNGKTKDAMNTNAALGSVDIGVGTKWNQNKWALRFAVTDIFNTQRWYQQTHFEQVQYDYNRKWESRSVRIQLTWKWGKTNYQNRTRNSGAQDAIDRIK